MEQILSYVVSVLVAFFQALPLRSVAWIGRRLGSVAYFLDARHRKIARQNLVQCFGQEKTQLELRLILREHFRRLGENYCCAIKTAGMPWERLRRHVEFANTEQIKLSIQSTVRRSCIVAIGHFGNFELYANFPKEWPGIKGATTYRALKQPGLNRIMQSLRERSGCLYFERRTDVSALKAALSEGNVLLGLLSDQHAGRHGLQLPFFGWLCSTTPAPAILALRYECPLFTGFCYRVGLGQWRVEAGDAIPTLENGAARSAEAIMLDVNRAFEKAIRRDPANWFWVHKRWKAEERGARNRPANAVPEGNSPKESVPL